ncbi:TPA: hypothetical protein ACSP2W_004096, partial [Aeromonas veronii]
VSASARRNHIRCHQKHRPDGQLETGRFLNPLIVDHNKTIENNNPELGGILKISMILRLVYSDSTAQALHSVSSAEINLARPV